MPGVWSWLCPSDNVHLQRNSTYTQYGYMYSSQVGELRLVTKADKTITVEVDGLTGDSLVPDQPTGCHHCQNCLRQSKVNANWKYYMEKPE